MTENAKKFIEANIKWPVVSGRAVEPDPRKPARGAVYRLGNGKSFRLTVGECGQVGMPRWAD